MKAVNSRPSNVKGPALVDLTLGPWEGKCNLLVVPLDDFDIILGNEFLLRLRAFVSPYLCGITISNGEKPTFVCREFKRNDTGVQGNPKILPALQLADNE